MPMMATTTKSSMSVKASEFLRLDFNFRQRLKPRERERGIEKLRDFHIGLIIQIYLRGNNIRAIHRPEYAQVYYPIFVS
jgi:hypothetical protein